MLNIENRKIVMISGPGADDVKSEKDIRYQVAYESARLLVEEHEAIILTGGKGGVMEAAARACKDAGGLSLSILPEDNASQANTYNTINMIGGNGQGRNVQLVDTAHAGIVIGINPGTWMEIGAFARTHTTADMRGSKPYTLLHSLTDRNFEGTNMHYHISETPEMAARYIGEQLVLMDQAVEL